MGERKRCSACGVCHVAYSLTNISSISPRASSMSQSDCLGPLIFRAFYRVAMGEPKARVYMICNKWTFRTKKGEPKKHYETSTFMAVRPSDTTNIVV